MVWFTSVPMSFVGVIGAEWPQRGCSGACLQASGDSTRAVEFHQRQGQGFVDLLVLGWEGKGYRVCPGI